MTRDELKQALAKSGGVKSGRCSIKQVEVRSGTWYVAKTPEGADLFRTSKEAETYISRWAARMQKKTGAGMFVTFIDHE